MDPWFRSTIRSEVNLQYWQLLPNGAGKDHWFWTKTIAPSSTDYIATLPDPAVPSSGSAQVRASLHGYTDAPQNPDHHTRVSFNGTQVSDATWNGMVPFLQEATVAAPLVIGGQNILHVDQIPDIGAAVDGIYLDWVEVSYDRYVIAVADDLCLATAPRRKSPSRFAASRRRISRSSMSPIRRPRAAW